MRILLTALLLLLVLCVHARAEQVLNVSCDTVCSVEVEHWADEWRATIQLTPEASESFYTMERDCECESFAVHAYGKALFRSHPGSHDHTKGRLWRRFASQADARAFAEVMCAAKVRLEDDTLQPSIDPQTYFEVEHPERVVSPGFAVSCDKVERMELFRMPLTRGNEEGYALYVSLNEKGSRDMADLLETANLQFFQTGGGVYAREHIQFIADGKRIVTDEPLMDNADKDGAYLTFTTLGRAEDAVEAICRQKAPDEVIEAR